MQNYLAAQAAVKLFNKRAFTKLLCASELVM